jgi:hypothetical protein
MGSVTPSLVRGDMNNSSASVNKLQRIKNLWEELGRTKANSPQYETLIIKIRALSADYQSSISAPNNLEHPQ